MEINFAHDNCLKTEKIEFFLKKICSKNFILILWKQIHKISNYYFFKMLTHPLQKHFLNHYIFSHAYLAVTNQIKNLSSLFPLLPSSNLRTPTHSRNVYCVSFNAFLFFLCFHFPRVCELKLDMRGYCIEKI